MKTGKDALILLLTPFNGQYKNEFITVEVSLKTS